MRHNQKFVSLVMLSAVTLSRFTVADKYAAPPAGGTIGGGFVSGGGGGGGFVSGGGGYDDGASSPAQYSYAYENVDPASGNQYGHGEERQGDVTQGEYRVLLPDGRTQIVKYYVTSDKGYVAEVTYEGTPINFGGTGGGSLASGGHVSKGGGGGSGYVSPNTGGGGYIHKSVE